MIIIMEIAWLAGILEGEGTFAFLHTPRISIGMTDLDIIEKVRKIWKTDNKITKDLLRNTNKERYTIRICGDLAIQWMLTLYSLMGLRRKVKIREVISDWKNMTGSHPNQKKRAECSIIKNIMKLRKISYEEALDILNSSLIVAKG